MDDSIARPKVGRVALALGFAGLLPPLGAVALILLGRRDPTDMAWVPLMAGYGLAMSYGAVILSFLGGIWWGFAMRRDERQGALAALAVMPSLAAVACCAAAWLGGPPVSGWPAVALGVAVLLTLPVDRRLVTTGEAPANWMRLRVPLSVGLATLLIAAGVLIGSGPGD